jgi:uncharacterized protein YxeA
MKKILCLILSVLLLFSMVACGQNNNTTNDTDTGESIIQDPTRDETQTEPPTEDTKPVEDEITKNEEVDDGEYKSQTYIIYKLTNDLSNSSTVRLHFTNKKYGNSETLGDYSRVFRDDDGNILGVISLYQEQYLSISSEFTVEEMKDIEITSDYAWTIKKLTASEQTKYRLFTKAGNEETVFDLILQGDDIEILKEIAGCMVVESWENKK